MAEAYVLGGRPYRSPAQQPTFAQRGYLMGTLRTHKIDVAINKDADVLAAIFSTGCASALLSGLLVEDGAAWTREKAIKNAAYFDGLTTDDDFTALCAALESLLAGFFPLTGSSSTASPTSSTPPARKARKQRRPRVPTPTSDTASSPDSSPHSPSSAVSA
jgi:hypothetical protein